MSKKLIWKAPRNNEPEPCVEIKYQGLSVMVPYTVIHLMAGWLAIGSSGSNLCYWDIGSRVNSLFDYLERKMSYDATFFSEEEIATYKKHGLWRGEPQIPKDILEWEEYEEADDGL